MRLSTFTFILFLLPVISFSHSFFTDSLSLKSNYALSPQADLPIVYIDISTGSHALVLGTRVKPLSISQINALNKNDINSFDRWAVNKNSKTAAKLSDAFLYSAILPATLVCMEPLCKKNGKNTSAKTTLIAAETFFAVSSITLLTKELVHRPRPYLYNPSVAVSEKVLRDSRYSFFSGHTSATAAMYFFSAQMFALNNPHSRFRPYVWTVCAIVPAITGVLRVSAGKHFPTDVITGYLVGASLGILIPRMHVLGMRNRVNRQSNYSAFRL